MSFDSRLLSGIGVLGAAVEAGSFARAADNLGLTASGVSRAIARLETRVGVRLLERTTRSLRLTEAGERFYEQVRPSLESIEAAAADAALSAGAVRGRLRVNFDPYLARLVVAPHLPDFLARYPDLELDLLTRENISDMARDGIDFALRFGEPETDSLTTKRLLTTRILTVASPAYIARHGRPLHPSDILHHVCILFRNPHTGRPFDWEFHRGGEILPVRASGPLTVGDVPTMLEACAAGIGIAQVMALGIADMLADGRLVDLFPDWPDEHFPLYALFPSHARPSARVRALVEFLKAVMPDET